MTEKVLTILMNGLSPRPIGNTGTFELGPGDEGDLEGRTCLAKDGEFTLFPASFVDVSLRRHYNLEMMENRKERWKELQYSNALGKMNSYWMTQQTLTSMCLYSLKASCLTTD
jgi:hypothetical protein